MKTRIAGVRVLPTRLRKIRRQRGSRTHGWGQVGQHRGSGQRGGRGKAGLHKHKWSWIVKFAPDYFGHDLTKPPFSSKIHRWINVGQIDDIWQKMDKKGRKSDKVLDLAKMGYGRLLGSGIVEGAYSVIVRSFTESAKAKIEKAGGKLVTG